ncbi:MAG: arginase family protein [Chitinophagales bacterium]|nr:arginase family protein [Bacteroidota bacterium]MCB9225828.1 arginase family protein [Chitinophagales bacterium]
MIFDFIEPVDVSKIDLSIDKLDQNQLGSKIYINTNNHIENEDNFNMVLLGVLENRDASVDEATMRMGLNNVRKEFYQLYSHFETPKILDIGNVKMGKTKKDSHVALEQVLQDLNEKGLTVVVIGGSHEMFYSQYKSFKNSRYDIDVVVVDAVIDFNSTEELNSSSHLYHIVTSTPNFLFTLSHLGQQLYYNSPQNIDKIEALIFESRRVGQLQQNIFEIEPIIRNADLMSFDLSAVKSADSPANDKASPNGLTGVEACQLSRFAGFSNKLHSFGIYEFNPLFDSNNQSAKQISQMIWYFIEGYTNRKSHDYPAESNKEFTKFFVKQESTSYELVFWKSNYSGKWWMEIPTKEDGVVKYLPCSYQDYENAMEDELPDNWMKVFRMLN